MSYSRQMPTYFVNAGGSATDWQLNYSRGLFASPAPSIDEAKNFEPYGLRANINVPSEIPKIVYGIPGLAVPVKIATPSPSLAAFPLAIDWNADGRMERMQGTFTPAVVDGTFAPPGDTTASLTLAAGTVVSTDTTSSGTVKLSAYIKFTADPGPITAPSVSASTLNGFTLATSGTAPPPPSVTISGVGNVRLVEVTMPFTRTTATAAGGAAFPIATVTLSGATASATFAFADITKGPSEIDIGNPGSASSATVHTAKVSGLSFFSPSGALGPTVNLRAKILVTFGSSITVGPGATPVTVVRDASSTISGATYGTVVVESVRTITNLTSSSNPHTQHIITIKQPVTLTGGVVSSGVPTFTVTIPHPSATLTKIGPHQSSPGISGIDLNNFGTIGCSASLDSTPPFSDYNDWIALNYDVGGVAGGLLSNGNSPQDITSQEVLLQEAGQNTFHIRDPLVEGGTNIQTPGQKVSVKFQLLTPTVPAQIISNAQVTLLAAPLNVACDKQGTSIPSSPTLVGPFSFNSQTKQYIKDWQTSKTAKDKWALIIVKNPTEILTIYKFQDLYTTLNSELYSIDVCFKANR